MKAALIGTIAFFVLAYLLPLGFRPLVSPDETRYCEIPREMIQSGDWIVPHLDGLRYFEKPCLGYWAIAASMLVFGDNAFAARLPSALSVGMSAILIAILAARSGRGRKVAILAPAVFLTFLEVFGVGTFNVLDSMFSALMTGAMTAFYCGYTEPDRRRRVIFLAVFGCGCGLTFLVKGFLAFVIPLLVIGPFAIWEHRWREALRAAWLPMAVALLVSLPWSIAVGLREADFWPYFIWVEHVQRFFHSKGGEHIQPRWYLWATLLLGTFPWNVFLASIAIGCGRTGLRVSFLRFLLCWASLPLVLFLTSKSTLGTYILPCYPPLALLTAVGLLNYLESGGTRLLKAGIMIAVSLAGLGILVLVVIGTARPFDREFFGPTEGWKWVLAIVSVATWLILLVLALRAVDYRGKLTLYCAAPLLGFMLSPLLFPLELHQKRMPGPFLQRQADHLSGNSVVVTDPALVHAVCWFYRRDDVRLLLHAGELQYGVGYPDSEGMMLAFDDFVRLVQSSSAEKPVVVILQRDAYEKYMRFLGLMNWEDRLPEPAYAAEEGGLWIGEFQGTPKESRPRGG